MDAVKEYKKRRAARIRARMDAEEWITINGTHVMVDEGGKITKGPGNLKELPRSGSASVKSAAGSQHKIKTVEDYKAALNRRGRAMSKKVLAEEELKEARAFRAWSWTKSEDSLKADIERCKKQGDKEGLEQAKHDLEELQDRVKKYGKDFGLAEAEKKAEKARREYEKAANVIKDFDNDRKRKAMHGKESEYGKRLADVRKELYAAEQLDDHDPTEDYDRAKREFKDIMRDIPDGVQIEMKPKWVNPEVGEGVYDMYTIAKDGDRYIGRIRSKEDSWRNEDVNWSADEFFDKYTRMSDYNMTVTNKDMWSKNDKAAEKEAKDLGTAYKVTDDGVRISFKVSGNEKNSWGKVVAKPEGEFVGDLGRFSVFKSGEENNKGYNLVLNHDMVKPRTSTLIMPAKKRSAK